MSLDSTPETVDIESTEATPEPAKVEVDPALQVRFKTQNGKTLLLLPPEPTESTASPWEEM
jgi:hypothetical protein